MPSKNQLKKSQIPFTPQKRSEFLQQQQTTNDANERASEQERERESVRARGRADGREREREGATEWPSKSGHGLWALIGNGDVAGLPNSHLFFLACKCAMWLLRVSRWRVCKLFCGRESMCRMHKCLMRCYHFAFLLLLFYYYIIII